MQNERENHERQLCLCVLISSRTRVLVHNFLLWLARWSLTFSDLFSPLIPLWRPLGNANESLFLFGEGFRMCTSDDLYS